VLSKVDDASALFSSKLTPLLRSDLFLHSVPDGARLAPIHQALRYLRGTAFLESRIVNDIVLDIAECGVGLDLPAEMRRDAYRIYTDEAYHAQFSVELATQIEDVTCVEQNRNRHPEFYTSLTKLERSAPDGYARLVRLLFVVCSETLITGSLANAGSDPTVAEPIRGALRDHAQDEGRHHTYFSAFLRVLWGQLDRQSRQISALVIPDLIRTFCSPDVSSTRVELAAYGITPDEIREIEEEVFPANEMWARAKDSSVHLLRILQDLEVTRMSVEVKDKYDSLGLS